MPPQTRSMVKAPESDWGVDLSNSSGGSFVFSPKKVKPQEEEEEEEEPAEEPLEDEPEFDLFGDDDADEAELEARVLAAQAKIDARNASKGKAPTVAKSALTIDVKPWEAETDMEALEEAVRAIAMSGLLWGKSQLVDLAFGVRKLQINAVVEDDNVSTDELEELVCELEDYVQSMDIVAFQKI